MLDFARLFQRVIMSLVVVTIASTASAAEPQWIWLGPVQDNTTLRLRKGFKIEGEVKSVKAAAAVDDEFKLFLNGQEVASGTTWREFATGDGTKHAVQGANTLAIQAKNSGGDAGVIAYLLVEYKDGKTSEVITDGSWVGSFEPARNWQAPGFDASSWKKVTVRGKIGQSGLPWSGEITPGALSTAFVSGTSGSAVARKTENVTVPAGFEIETLFDVPKSMGSWVSVANYPGDRLVVSDQGKAGLFVITPARNGQPTHVEKLPVELSGFQGLLWAFDALYGVINGGAESGLYRLTDTDGDGLVDAHEHLMKMDGGGEHGPHGIVLSPDGKSLYLVAGNHTKLPAGITSSQIPTYWDEDMLLPRRWDANGHAAGILAPGGYILKLSPDAKEREVVSIGYRNQYDLAFNADGELFTYDSDMEWDFGAPWYRPTRVNHVTGGSEFGWRSGTGNWPEYFEDSLGAVVNIGPGSPVGVTFGYGANFPAKYQKALFLLDWTYSSIYAIHLEPNGSSYTGTLEDFAVGRPMQVTDGIIGTDGAFYFAAGGRGTQSSLHRIVYTGSESTAPVNAHDEAGAAARSVRHELEAFHNPAVRGNLELITEYLGSDDRELRYAARVALEFQPILNWKSRVLEDQKLSPRAKISAMIALAHRGSAQDQTAVLKTLNSIDYASQPEDIKLALLRAYQLAFTRLGHPSEENRQLTIDTLDPHYPAETYFQNAELCQLLVYLSAPDVVTKTLKIMSELGPEPIPSWGHLIDRSKDYGGTIGAMMKDMPPTRGIHFAFALRNQKEHWTLDQRREYFQFFVTASKHSGGNSFTRFLSQMRDDALLTCTPTELTLLSDITSANLVTPAPEVKPPVGPGREWTTPTAVAAAGDLKNRNLARGRELYFATQCGKCHRLNGEGGSIGPDLSSVGNKFSLADLLDAIIEPSKAISDQYASHQVVTADGQVHQGRAVEIGDEIHVYTPDADAPPVVVKKADVEEMLPSPVSQMPVGLINTLNEDELRDLLAYLQSASR